MAGVPTTVDGDIKACIDDATHLGLAAVAAPGRPANESSFVIKYTSAKFGGTYPPMPNKAIGAALYVSPSPGFTWGAALYVCPVAYPLSGAIYGRCGVVAELRTPAGWRIFDATDGNSANLYVQWIQRQPMFPLLTLTAHASFANQLLRNLFRRRFQIDVVVFPPDEFNNHYTRRNTDRWLAISEWAPGGGLMTVGPATRAVDPRLCVVLAEEFEPTRSGIRRKTFIGPTRGLASTRPTPADLIRAYANNDLLLVAP